uniref:Uncharacterized protein n=1 Tax=Arundo donax TaxID=35708 RepID=A0A0A8ZKB0_ARUDO
MQTTPIYNNCYGKLVAVRVAEKYYGGNRNSRARASKRKLPRTEPVMDKSQVALFRCKTSR